MDSIFNRPNFDEKEYFPDESTFEKIAAAFNDVKTNGADYQFASSPNIIATVGGRSCKALSKKIIVSVILHWDDLTKLLQENWKLMAPISDLKKIIGLFVDDIDEYKDIIDKYEKASVQISTKQEDEGIFTMSTYDANGVRRHIRVGKKLNGIYNVCVDSAQVSSFDNLFLFKNKKACEDFIQEVKNGSAKTVRPVDTFQYKINTKIYPQMEPDLTKYVLVNTTCGQAYICRNSQFCED